MQTLSGTVPPQLTQAARDIMLSGSWEASPDDYATLTRYYQACDDAARQARECREPAHRIASTNQVPASVAFRKSRAFSHPGPLRVYASNADRTGTMLCPRHRGEFFASFPGACSDGQRGQWCEICQPVSV